MPRLILVTVNDHKGQASVACDYANDLKVTGMFGESSGGTRTVALVAPGVVESQTFTQAGSGTRNVRPRDWFLTIGSEGELLVPFSVQVF